MSKRILCLQRCHPGRRAREALDVTLVAGVFDQTVALLFRDEGVWQLTPAGKETADPDTVALEESIRSLPDYGIKAIFVCARSLTEAGLRLDDLILPAEALGRAAQAALISRHDMVLND